MKVFIMGVMKEGNNKIYICIIKLKFIFSQRRHSCHSRIKGAFYFRSKINTVLLI